MDIQQAIRLRDWEEHAFRLGIILESYLETRLFEVVADFFAKEMHTEIYQYAEGECSAKTSGITTEGEYRQYLYLKNLLGTKTLIEPVVFRGSQCWDIRFFVECYQKRVRFFVSRYIGS